ncbi:MAG: methyltransferase domain-containing protein, partial [Planctomycetes bacterium]|nr:methyltransferase domain-containing protein [Planctomycetota bacterium]
REDRDKRWHLTIHQRAWWEQRFLEHGLRKHTRGQAVLPYSAIDREDRDGRATLVFERLPAEALRAYPLSSLKAERDLHTDMFREAGQRSDAHIARYMLAAQFVRPNDRVLDVSCGLGYGSAVLWYNAEPERVTGVDVSDFAIEYATANYAHTGAGAAQQAAVEFRVGDAQELSFLANESVDLVVSFETLEHLRDPSAFLAEAHRVLTPGGRLVASVPNNWTDESGADPNKDHLHVYDWSSLSSQIGERFLIEAAFAQIAGGGMKLTDRPRSMVRLDVTPDGSGPDGEAEWWLIVAMKDPVGAEGSIDADRHFPAPAQADKFNVTAFARDYDNPWLVRAMVSIGLRADSAPLLELIASRALDSARPGSSDEGAALCVLGYQRLGAGPGAGDAAELVERLLAYQRRADKTPHAWRWRISDQYLAALLLVQMGRHDEAKEAFVRCARMDPCKFSPLLATKTVAACFEAGMLHASGGDIKSARAIWRRGIQQTQRVLSGSWTNIIGNVNSPLPFGLPEACQVLDAASRCAWALLEYRRGVDRPGYAWEAAHSRSPLSNLQWLRKLQRAKDWLESQRASWQQLADDRGQSVRSLSEFAEQLRAGNEWLTQEQQRLGALTQQRDQTIEDLRVWIEQQDEGKRWLDEQHLELLRQTGDRDRTIAELRAWIDELGEGKRWIEEQHLEILRRTGDRDRTIAELRTWIDEQDQGKRWLEQKQSRLIESNDAREKQMCELRSWIGELEKGKSWLENERKSLLQRNELSIAHASDLQQSLKQLDEHRSHLESSMSELSAQLGFLRGVHADLSERHYRLIDQLRALSQNRWSVRRRLRGLVGSIQGQGMMGTRGGESAGAAAATNTRNTTGTVTQTPGVDVR